MPSKPQDHKSKKTDPYILTVGDERFEIPKMSSLATFSTIRRLRKLDQLDQALTLLEENIEPADMERLEKALDPLGEDGITKFINGWSDDSEITLGGILGLCDLVEEHREAVEYDLITHGLRLAWLPSKRLSWRDLLIIIKHQPPGSALERAMDDTPPSERGWGLSEYLLAAVKDELAVANWQRQGDSKAKRPKPTPRPGLAPDDEETTTFGRGALPVDEMRDWLGWAA